MAPDPPSVGIQSQIWSKHQIDQMEASSFPEGPDSGGNVIWQTLVSNTVTPTDSLTCGIATCAPVQGTLNCHRHAQAEIYYIISGSGLVFVDGKEHLVSTGSVVYIPRNVEHGVRNEHPTEELKWLYCFAADGFDEIVYKFSAEAFPKTAQQAPIDSA